MWRIVGIPFYVAFFDKYGADYCGSFTHWSVIGNTIFWFLVPQIILGIVRCAQKVN